MVKYNRETFFAGLKKELFTGKFVGSKGAGQISGLDLLLNEAEKRNTSLDEFATS